MHHAMKTYGGMEGRCSSTILDLSTRLRWIMSFTPQPLYVRGKNPPVSIGEKIG
jgi:hypothetical protein